MILRNRKSTVTDAQGQLIFRGHEVHRVPVRSSPRTINFQRQLTEYFKRGYKAGESGGKNGRAIGFVMVIYRKLASSSIAAIERALSARLDRLIKPAPSSITMDIEHLDELFESGDDQDNIGHESPALQFFQEEDSILRSLIEAAQEIRQNDEKLVLFLDQIVAPLIKEKNTC